MSEGNRVQGMVRSINQWRNMVPSAVAAGSAAQVEYALTDAKTDIEALWCKVAALTAGEQEPVAWLYDWIDGNGETQTDASTQSVKSVNFQPVRNVRSLYLAPPTAQLEALRKERDTWRDNFSAMHQQTMTAEARVAELEKALDGVLSAETHLLHTGYDGGGNYEYVDVIRADDEAFRTARRVREGERIND